MKIEHNAEHTATLDVFTVLDADDSAVWLEIRYLGAEGFIRARMNRDDAIVLRDALVKVLYEIDAYQEVMARKEEEGDV